MGQSVEEFIEHHGTKGMKWGVRKKRTPSSDYKKTAPLRKKKPKELSNKQLEAINKRRNLEKNFKQLNPSPAKQILKLPQQGQEIWKAGAIAGGAGVAAVAFIRSGKGQALMKQAIDKLSPVIERHGAEAVQLALKFD